MNLSVADKLAIAPLLDELGVGFIEGGWPGAVPKDTEFFKRGRQGARLPQRRARGVRHHPQGRRRARPTTRRCGRCVDSEAPVVTLVAKHDIRHVERALRTTRRGEPRDDRGHRRVPACARGAGSSSTPSTSSTATGSTPTTPRAAVAAAFEAGAEVVALCDTNGGMLPDWVARDRARDAREPSGRTPILGIHAHNDSGLRGRQHPRRRRGRVPRTCRAPSTGTASAPATPTCSPSSRTSSSSTACRCSTGRRPARS